MNFAYPLALSSVTPISWPSFFLSLSKQQGFHHLTRCITRCIKYLYNNFVIILASLAHGCRGKLIFSWNQTTVCSKRLGQRFYNSSPAKSLFLFYFFILVFILILFFSQFQHRLSRRAQTFQTDSSIPVEQQFTSWSMYNTVQVEGDKKERRKTGIE